MDEVIFIAEKTANGEYIAKAVGFEITAEADNYKNLKIGVVDAVKHHFNDKKKRTIRLQTITEDVLEG